MVLDLGVSNIPMPVFMLVHVTGFAIGAYLSYKSFERGGSAFGWAFALFAVAEVLYMGYHMEISTFLLSHTLAEVCDLVAFILAFVGAGQAATSHASSLRTTKA